MGNSSTKEARPSSSREQSRLDNPRHPSSPTASGPSQQAGDRSLYSSRGGRSSRPDLSFLGLGTGGSERDPALEPRRETRAEREARKQEKERVAREKERERSIREEGVDGGYLVTLGTYIGPEDFSKPVVRQLQIERRLAPFWKGLNDHSDTWTEHQLTAVVNDLPLPPADEIPPEEPSRSKNLSPSWNPRSSNPNLSSQTIPIASRSASSTSERSMNLSPSHPAFSLPSPSSPIATQSSSSPFFRGRAKTLAALTTSSRNNSQSDMTPQEIQLPKDPYVNGQRLEAFLYRNASECPICFLYYPPHLNKTRCCDQPICSECFVQIKRPDPHPPEHHDDPANPDANPPSEPQEDVQLVSEPAACPFCVQPEFGVTYEPPPFRRGLAYANQGRNALISTSPAMSSTSSLNSQGISSPGATRRRATSLAATDSNVITTDRVRPDWAKKLADARAHALRRAAAATALHNAAYMMGNLQQADSRGFGLGRRRRTLFGGDSPSHSGRGSPRHGSSADLAASGRTVEGQNDLFSARHSSRRNRIEDLEELMMMEAIRLSLAAEEERKKKEEKEAAKEAKKEEKKKAKETKKAEKAHRKSGFFGHGMNGVDFDNASSSAHAGKGKAVDRSGGHAGFNPLLEPTSTLNSTSSKDDPQRHLEQSRAQIRSEVSSTHTPSPLDPPSELPGQRSTLRNLSSASSSASSFSESLQNSARRGSTDLATSNSTYGLSPNASGVSLSPDETPPPPQGTPSNEPMFNFRSLAAVITNDEKEGSSGAQHIEHLAEPPAQGSPASTEPNRSRGDSGESSGSSLPPLPQISLQPPEYEEQEKGDPLGESVATVRPTRASNDQDEIEPAPRVEVVSSGSANGFDAKHCGEVTMFDSMAHHGQATQ